MHACMERMKVHVSVLQSVILCLLVCVAFSKQECGKYAYLTQPPLDLNCNPYGNTRFTRLECNVAGPNYLLINTEPEFTIKWYRKRNNNFGQVEEIDGTNFPDLAVDVDTWKVVSPSVPSVMGIRSQLELIRPTNVSEGTYWCQIIFSGDRDMVLNPSMKFRLQSPEWYKSVPDCIRGTLFLEVSECVGNLSNTEEPMTTTEDAVVPTCSSSSEQSEGSIFLPKKWIIIIGCIGGSLLVVVVILTIFLVMVFAQMRGRRRQHTQPERTAIVKKEVKKPPPVAEKPASLSSSTTNICDLSNQSNGSVSITPRAPLLVRGGVRCSLPTRLPITVKQDEEEEYTPVLSQRDRNTCTLIQKLKVVCEQPKVDKQKLDNSFTTPLNEYHGLNPQMMDDIQPYDSTRGAHSYNSDTDVESNDDLHPEYTEPDTHIWSQRERTLVLSVDGEYVYPNTDSAAQESYKQLMPNQQEYMPMYATPDNR